MAWHDMGWSPAAFSEIEKFPSEVLAHHYPTVPNLGDMTNYKEWDLNGSIGLLVGGTPCQSFSVAGLRKGLEDPRGNLALTYVGILDKFRPKWCIWENVPGVLSSNGGRDLGSFLGALVELGYGFSYRVLDAQYFGVPQRRRRIFVVGCLGDWESPAKVLFERESLRRDTPPSREKKQATASFTPSSFGNYSEGVGTLRSAGGDLGGGSETLVATNRMVAFGEYSDDGTASTLKARDYKDATDLIVYETHPADSRVKPMGDVCQTVTSRWGTGGGNVPLVQEAYSIREDAKANNFSATPLEVTPALQALRPSVQSHHAQTFIAQAVDVYNQCIDGDVAATLTMACGGSNTSGPKILDHAVRRLTPVECERLQGFPDGFTNIPWRGKPESPDAPRYKAMGNSMAVPVMAWIGKRIQKVEDGLF
jgi:DNA (cytosine-5)-methyltransferase 1